MTLAQKRLAKEVNKFLEHNPKEMSITQPEFVNNCNIIVATLKGPRDTLWENNEYKLELKFKANYPINAPDVRFLTPIFHPNVYSDGRICLDILSGEWSPIYSIEAILTSIRSLLCDPNPNSPANSEAASLYTSNLEEFAKRNKQNNTGEAQTENKI